MTRIPSVNNRVIFVYYTFSHVWEIVSFVYTYILCDYVIIVSSVIVEFETRRRTQSGGPRLGVRREQRKGRLASYCSSQVR